MITCKKAKTVGA